MVLFFETCSVAQTFFLWRYIKRAKIIYFHSRGFPKIRHNLFKKRFVENLIFLINREAVIKSIPMEVVAKYNWILNRESIRFTEELAPDIEKSLTYKTVREIIKDDNVLKCYKVYLVDKISAGILFLSIANDLSSKNDVFFVIPEGLDYLYFIGKLFANNELTRYIPYGIYWVNKIRGLLYRLIFSNIFIILPAAFIVIKFNKLTFKKIKKVKYDLAMPFIWGFHDDERQRDDGYLYNHRIKPGQILHIFNFWRYPQQIEMEQKKALERRSIPYADIQDYKVTPRFLWSAIKTELTIIVSSVTGLFYLFEKNHYILYSAFILRHILNTRLELENVDFKVEFLRIDYSPDHIIKTIICNQQGKKTVAIQHSSFSYVLPQLCYTHVDKYIVYGDIFIKSFSPFWDKIKIVKTGRENIDWVARISTDKNAVVKLRERLFTKYGVRKYTAVIAFPSGEAYNMKRQWEEVYNALCQLKISDIDLNLFLRFRDKNDPDRFAHIQRFMDLPRADKRFIVDYDEFTIYELMVLSDLFVANNLSYSIYESLAAGDKVFTFDFTGLPEYVYSDYGKDFILHTKEELLNVFRGLLEDFKGFDCKWAKLKNDSNFYYDGRNLERIQRAVWDTVKETA